MDKTKTKDKTKNETTRYTISIPVSLKNRMMKYVKRMGEEKNIFPRGIQSQIIEAGLDALQGGKK